MPDETLLLESLSAFARTLVTPYEVESALADLTGRVVAVLGLCGSGVALSDAGGLRFATALTAAAAALEAAQSEHQSGPCIDAFESGEPVLVPDLWAAAKRWPEYAAAGAEHGIRAVASIPMWLASRKVGALDLYADAPRDWTPGDVATARVMADMATGYVINSSTLHQEQALTVQLQAALDSRVVIEQAKGITARDRGVGVDEAFQLIRRHARSHNTGVRAVAEAIVGVGLRV